TITASQTILQESVNTSLDGTSAPPTLTGFQINGTETVTVDTHPSAGTLFNASLTVLNDTGVGKNLGDWTAYEANLTLSSDAASTATDIFGYRVDGGAASTSTLTFSGEISSYTDAISIGAGVTTPTYYGLHVHPTIAGTVTNAWGLRVESLGTATNKFSLQSDDVAATLRHAGPLQVGTIGAAQFRVDATGNLIRINDVPYSWPASQGAFDTILRDDGA